MKISPILRAIRWAATVTGTGCALHLGIWGAFYFAAAQFIGSPIYWIVQLCGLLILALFIASGKLVITGE